MELASRYPIEGLILAANVSISQFRYTAEIVAFPKENGLLVGPEIMNASRSCSSRHQLSQRLAFPLVLMCDLDIKTSKLLEAMRGKAKD